MIRVIGGENTVRPTSPCMIILGVKCVYGKWKSTNTAISDKGAASLSCYSSAVPNHPSIFSDKFLFLLQLSTTTTTTTIITVVITYTCIYDDAMTRSTKTVSTTCVTGLYITIIKVFFSISILGIYFET